MIDSIVPYEEIIKSGRLVIHPHGVSMWPMIRNGKDSVVIEPVSGRLNKYDIPLYKTDNGKYVVHRIIEVTEKGYVICGDGLFEREYNITDKNIIGVITGFFRKEKYIPCTSKGYIFYSKLWVGLIGIRKPIIVVVRKCRRVKDLTREYTYRLFKGRGLYAEKDKSDN
ncbi:MAG: S24/S26 family peptidase [Ruminococcus sp.]